MKTQLPCAVFLGSLKNSEVQETWSGIGVLLSTAPFESYGLAMREALLHNVPVVSRRNAGSLELKEKYPNLIGLFDGTEEAVTEITEILQRTGLARDFIQFRSDFFNAQDETLTTMARVWSNEV
jgi:glycosyltransferase involved in cell wall biosynthesis